MKYNVRVLLIVSLVAFALVLMSASAQAVAPSVGATVCIKDSSNANITPAAGSIYYKIGSTNFFANNVDGNGCRYQDFPAGTTNVEVWAVINNTTSAHKTQDISSNPQFDFNTKKMTLRLEKCDATPLNGAEPRYGAGTNFGAAFWPGGKTGSGSNAAGESSAEVFSGGTFSFDMGYQATAAQKMNIVIADPPQKLVWQTTKVTLNYNGAISYGGGAGDSTWFTKPSMELMPGTVKFHFRPVGANPGYTTDLTFSGCAYTKTAAVLRLRNSSGLPLAGGTARGGYTTPTVWHVPGTTDANGILFNLVDGTPANLAYEMKYNNTIAVKGPQDPAVNSFFDFQTILLTLRLETCANAPLDGGLARYGAGASYTSWWFPGGATGSQGTPGEVSAQVLPGGQYSFAMGYKGTEQPYPGNPVTIPAANTKLTWQTTKVTVQYSGAISFGGPTGQSQWFVKPSMELMPGGPYKFHFQSPEGGRLDFTWSGCDFTKSVFALKLMDSTGTGIAGATGNYYITTWLPIPGTTDSDGILPYALDGLKTNVHTQAILQGMIQQKPPQNIATNSVFVYQTIPVSFKLKAMDGSTDLAAQAQYYAGAWRTFGTGVTPATMQMLPVTNLSFGVRYLGAWQQKTQDITTNPNVVFQTGQVTSSTCTQFYASSWQAFTSGQEMLPVSTIFADANGPNTPATPVVGSSIAVVCP